MRLENASLPKAAATPADLKKMRAAAKATGLPGIEESPWFNRPTLKVAGKWLICARQAGVYVFVCPLAEKDLLIEMAPDIYFDTDHHAGYAAVLAWADKIAPKDLADRIARAWRIQAPKTLQQTFDQPPARAAKAKPKRKAKS
ncbi:MAG: hypothetical protein SFV19_06405 [Rhodospirillaceae bacterium]|nr:hypothetical protein [Rhodospirillaceae bacterium]